MFLSIINVYHHFQLEYQLETLTFVSKRIRKDEKSWLLEQQQQEENLIFNFDSIEGNLIP